MEDIELSGEWTPIPTVYSGTFKGNGKTISGLTINTPSGTKQGLFAETNGATIQDLTISCSILNETTGTEASTGAFVATATNTTFKNCSTTDDSTVTGLGYKTAGVAGWVSNSTFENCTNLAAINGCMYSAGIVGYVYDSATITNCKNEGSIKDSTGGYVGGIAGRLYGVGVVINCTNSATIEGYSYVGGIVGSLASSGSTVTGCSNSGNVTTGALTNEEVNKCVGGVTGYSGTDSYIADCYNTAEISGPRYVAGISGCSIGATILNCENRGDVNGTNKWIGGVTGYSGTDSYIADCYNTAEVSGYQYVAGISSYNDESIISNCGNSGDVASTHYNVGGITGANNSSTIINCYNTAAISTANVSYVAGIAADNNSYSSIINCYNQGDISLDKCGIAYRSHGSITNCYSSQDGIVYYNYGTTTLCYYDSGDNDVEEASGIIGVSTANMTSNDFVETLSANAQAYNNSSPTLPTLACNWASATASYPTLNFDSTTSRGVKSWNISNATELKDILGAIGGDTYYAYDTYKLTANITLTDEWTPVAEVFSGTLNGNGKTISGLKITSDANRIGFFAETDGATIQNLTIEGTITNTGATSEMSGAFVGKATNSIFSSCATTSETTVSGKYRNTGGLVGWAVGTTFTNCKNYATVIGAQYTGGIVATVSTDSPSTFTNCTNYGSVSDQSGSVCGHLGGIVGYYSGSSTMSGCTNEGDITSTYSFYIGGLVGRGYDGSITDCNNKGAVSNTGGTDVGGVVGYNSAEVSSSTNSGTISNKTDTVGGVVGCNDGGSVTSATNSGYVSGTAGYVGGVVGYNKSGELTSLTNKGEVKNETTGYYIGGTVGYNAGTITLSKNSGKVTSGGSYIGGIAGYTTGSISSSANGGEINNISTGHFTGGITGYITSSRISLSTNSGKVICSKYAGGIAGQVVLSATLSECSNSGEIESSDSYCGGIAGQVESSATLFECSNSGEIKSSDSYCGGVVGVLSTGNVYNSYNTAKVTALGHVAGIVGEAQNSTVFNCYNKGTISGTGTTDEINVAGLVGHLYTTATLKNSYNLGTVTSSTNYVGGLVGTAVSGSVTKNCYSAATVVGVGSNVDCVIGSCAGDVSLCYFDSTISAISFTAATAKTTTELQNSDFVDTLNEFVDSYNIKSPIPLALTWKAVSGSYPTFE
ncbi:MAG: GLUG motif-containing protein [Rikenellaceae bacterium]